MQRKAFNNVQLLSEANILKQGDTFNYFQVELLDKMGSPVDVSGSSVKWTMANDKGVVVHKDAQIDDATNGLISLHLTPEDVTGAGQMRIEIKMDDGVAVQKFPSYGYLHVVISKTLEDMEQTPISYASFKELESLLSAFTTENQEWVVS